MFCLVSLCEHVVHLNVSLVPSCQRNTDWFTGDKRKRVICQFGELPFLHADLVEWFKIKNDSTLLAMKQHHEAFIEKPWNKARLENKMQKFEWPSQWWFHNGWLQRQLNHHFALLKNAICSCINIFLRFEVARTSSQRTNVEQIWHRCIMIFAWFFNWLCFLSFLLLFVAHKILAKSVHVFFKSCDSVLLGLCFWWVNVWLIFGIKFSWPFIQHVAWSTDLNCLFADLMGFSSTQRCSAAEPLLNSASMNQQKALEIFRRSKGWCCCCNKWASAQQCSLWTLATNLENGVDVKTGSMNIQMGREWWFAQQLASVTMMAQKKLKRSF